MHAQARPLTASLQFELSGEAGLVAIVKPCRQSLCSGEQIYVSGNETGVNIVVRLLNFRVLQSGLLKARGVGEPVNVNDVDQLNGSFGLDATLTGGSARRSEDRLRR